MTIELMGQREADVTTLVLSSEQRNILGKILNKKGGGIRVF